MPETFCKDCKHDGDNVCKFTGIRHNTGITCPSFGVKEEEVEMSNNAGIGKTVFIDDQKGVLEIKVDPADPCGGSTAVYKKDTSMESYKSGATRTQCETKIDPEGFFSPLVVLRYSEYMHKCRVQANGTLRNSDNWQGGIPLWRYMKGKWRHFLDTWLMHRGYKKMTDEGLDLQDCLCAEMFNTMGYLHEVLCEEKGVKKDQNVPTPGGAHTNFKDRTAQVEGGY